MYYQKYYARLHVRHVYSVSTASLNIQIHFSIDDYNMIINNIDITAIQQFVSFRFIVCLNEYKNASTIYLQ